MCAADLADAVQTNAGWVHCSGCGHLWQVVDGAPYAVNSGGILTAAGAAALIAKQVDG